MRAIFLAALCALTLSSCATRRVIIAPSAAPVRNPISRAQTHAAKAKAALASIPQSAISNQQSAIALATAGAEVDALTHELTVAQTALNKFEQETAELAAQADKDRHRLAAAEVQAKKNAKMRNRFALLALGFAAWIFREPLLRLGGFAFKAARLAVGIPV